VANMFEDIKKQAALAQKRWDEIGEKAEELKQLIEPGGSIEEASRKTAELVLLLVEQFKPMSQIESQDFMKEFVDMFTIGGEIK